MTNQITTNTNHINHPPTTCPFWINPANTNHRPTTCPFWTNHANTNHLPTTCPYWTNLADPPQIKDSKTRDYDKRTPL